MCAIISDMKKHITLCGSMIFESKMQDIAQALEKMGFFVTCPTLTDEEKNAGADTFMKYIDSLGGVSHVLPDDPLWKVKGNAMREYKEYIDKADALLVCNFDKGGKLNRIGDNSFLEMGYAFLIDKKIFVRNNPPYGDEKIEEVLGMTPIFLRGNLEKSQNLYRVLFSYFFNLLPYLKEGWLIEPFAHQLNTNGKTFFCLATWN